VQFHDNASIPYLTNISDTELWIWGDNHKQQPMLHYKWIQVSPKAFVVNPSRTCTIPGC
jgi:hypothetical protein